MRKILIFSFPSEKEIVVVKYTSDLQIKKWTPSLTRYIPPGSPINYLLFWIAHFVRFFKSGKYCSLSLLDRGKPICTMVCAPALFLWPFMGEKDIQIKNVFTHPDYRGKGLANYLLSKVLGELKDKETTFWYLTHSENHGSIALAKKAGFSFEGIYKKKRRRFYFLKTGSIVKVD